MVSISDLIQKQPRRPVVVSDDDVSIAVVVDITESGAATDFEQLERGTRRIRGVDELSFSVIVKELIRLAQRIRVGLAHQLRQQLN